MHQENSNTRASLAIMLMLLLALTSVATRALYALTQSGPPAPSRPTPDTASSNDNSAPPRVNFGVNVDMVLIDASVTDKNNHFVSGIEPGRFRVLEDGVEQKISSLKQDDAPVSMGIILDLSGSMRNKIERVNQATLALIQAGRPEDEFFLIGFNDEVELLEDYTGDIDELRDALENTITAGETHLYDAIYLGVEKAQTGSRTRKAVIVITDGDDYTSYYRLTDLVAKIQEAEVKIFCIGFLNEMPKKNIWGKWTNREAKNYYDALVRIAEETGGSAFFPQNVNELPAMVRQIANDLHGQYRISYISSNTARDGSYRKVKVELRDAKAQELQIRYRRGYFAPGGKKTPTQTDR